jgi:hypothetical protein
MVILTLVSMLTDSQGARPAYHRELFGRRGGRRRDGDGAGVVPCTGGRSACLGG